MYTWLLIWKICVESSSDQLSVPPRPDRYANSGSTWLCLHWWCQWPSAERWAGEVWQSHHLLCVVLSENINFLDLGTFEKRCSTERVFVKNIAEKIKTLWPMRSGLSDWEGQHCNKQLTFLTVANPAGRVSNSLIFFASSWLLDLDPGTLPHDFFRWIWTPSSSWWRGGHKRWKEAEQTGAWLYLKLAIKKEKILQSQISDWMRH